MRSHFHVSEQSCRRGVRGHPATVAAPLSSWASLATLRREIDPRYPPPRPARLRRRWRAGSAPRPKSRRGTIAVIAMRDVRLLTVAVQFFNLGNARVLRSRWRRCSSSSTPILRSHPDCSGFREQQQPRDRTVPKYREPQELFDLLYADMSANPKDAFFITSRIVVRSTSAGIAAPADRGAAGARNRGRDPDRPATARPAAPRTGGARAARAAGEHAPRPRRRRSSRIIYAALLAHRQHPMPCRRCSIASASSTRRSGDRRAGQEIAAIVFSVSRLPPGARPDYATLARRPARRARPHVRAPGALIAVRKDRRGVPELVSAVGRGNEEALEALLALGGPTDWNAARLKLAQAAGAASRTEPRADEQAPRRRAWRYVALHGRTRRRGARAGVRRGARAQFDRQLAAALASRRTSDPKRYAADAEIALKGAEGLLAAMRAGTRRGLTGAKPRRPAAPRGLVRGSRCAGTGRGPRRCTERAIALSEALPEMENIGLMERISLADTLRFDLKDPRRAQRIYEQLQQRIARDPPPTNDIEAVLLRLVAEWLRAEIAYLGEGRRYAGNPDRDTLGAIAMVTSMAPTPFAPTMRRSWRSPPRSARAQRASAGRPSSRSSSRTCRRRRRASWAPSTCCRCWGRRSGSRASCAGTIRRASSVPAPSRSWHVLEEIAAGRTPEASAGVRVLAWTARERCELMREAETLALGRQVAVDLRPDPGLGSPEATWKTFLAALRRNDLDAAWKCTTPGIRNSSSAASRP